MLAEFDLALINALQVYPRADWAQVGAALGVAGSTAARRWKSLVRDGDAWVTSAPGPGVAGRAMFVYLTAEQGQLEALARRLCDEPAAATVSMISGPFDFVVDSFASSAAELIRTAADTFPSLPGVARSESAFVVEIHRHGSTYHSGVIRPDQMQMLRHAPGTRPSSGVAPDAVDMALLSQLNLDGRASWAALGALSGISPQTTRRRMETLEASGYLTFRCDCSDEARGPLQEVRLMFEVPRTSLSAAAEYFAGTRECRVCMEVISAHNLVVTLWLEDLRQVDRFERELTQLAPGTITVSRNVILNTFKRLGHVLDRSGRSIRIVPMYG